MLYFGLEGCCSGVLWSRSPRAGCERESQGHSSSRAHSSCSATVLQCYRHRLGQDRDDQLAGAAAVQVGTGGSRGGG